MNISLFAIPIELTDESIFLMKICIYTTIILILVLAIIRFVIKRIVSIRKKNFKERLNGKFKKLGHDNVTLQNGKVVKYAAVLMVGNALNELLEKPIVLCNLLQSCKNPNYVLYDDDMVKQELKRYDLMDQDGNIHDVTKNIVLCSVTIGKKGIPYLINPIKEENK